MQLIGDFLLLTPVNEQAPTEVVLGQVGAIRCECIVAVSSPGSQPPGSLAKALVQFCQVGEAARSAVLVRESPLEILEALQMRSAWLPEPGRVAS